MKWGRYGWTAKGIPEIRRTQKGTPNKINRQEEIRKAAARGRKTPLEWMLSVLNDEKADIHRRDEMARAAAPYLHARRAPEDKQGNAIGLGCVRVKRIDGRLVLDDKVGQFEADVVDLSRSWLLDCYDPDDPDEEPEVDLSRSQLIESNVDWDK